MTRSGLLFDVLSHPPARITSGEIKQKRDDVQNSAICTVIFGALTGLGYYLEASMIYLASLAALTITLGSCFYNETKRLSIMKTIPLRDENKSPSTPSLSDSPIQ